MLNSKRTFRDGGLFYFLLLCVMGMAINIVGVKIALFFGWFLFLDSIGTVLAAALGGYLPGIAVGYLTNIVNGVNDPATTYYASLSVLIAVIAAYGSQHGWFRSLKKMILLVILMSLAGGGLGSVLTWLMYGFSFGEGISAPLAHWFHDSGVLPLFWSQFTADMIIDVADKTVTVAISALALFLMPQKIQELFYFTGWQQTPLQAGERHAAQEKMARRISLRAKTLFLLCFLTILIAGAATVVFGIMNHQTTLDTHIKLGQGAASMAASAIDGDQVDEFIEAGESAPGYLETEEKLAKILEGSPDIQYIYVYKIEKDGCHVVFDIDTPEVKGNDPGDVIDFDEAFTDDLPLLLAGQPIEPLVSNETFGWLLTVYQPVQDSNGKTVCYACSDVSMKELTLSEISLLAKVFSLFLGFFILILAVGLWAAEYNIILPINTMAMATRAFAYNSENVRADSLDKVRGLRIHTGDEIENLYDAISKTTGDTVRYIADINRKNEEIAKMQNGLIMTLADMVESRDKCTGDHVRKTALYARLIMEQLRREGRYAEYLTDQFIEDVYNSAPLHDVGKIQISDTLLNKPGRLTDEEFEEMKKHTGFGGVIISRAIEISPDPGYLSEARNLAAFHHERWDGKGYPAGLKGEEIPLSARIMAVADVFDALVSRRSYKEPYSVDKAMDIIREESGTHFDPYVVEAFLHVREEARAIAEQTLENEALDFSAAEKMFRPN